MSVLKYVPDSVGLALGPAPVNLGQVRNSECFKAAKMDPFTARLRPTNDSVTTRHVTYAVGCAVIGGLGLNEICNRDLWYRLYGLNVNGFRCAVIGANYGDFLTGIIAGFFLIVELIGGLV